MTCSVCELRAGPDHLAREHAAAVLGVFKQASVLDVRTRRDGQLSDRLGFADGCNNRPAKPCKSELCSCTKPADAANCGVSADTSAYLVRLAVACYAAALQLARLIDVFLQQSAPNTTSSTADGADRDLLQCTQRPAILNYCKLVPTSSKLAARSSLYTKRAGLQPTLTGKRNPSCIKQWAALTTWIRMNLHQVGHCALTG